MPHQQTRQSSHSPLGTASGSARARVTVNSLQAMYRRGEPIAMITAHDFPSAHVADAAGVDIVLVGDSLAMVALGMDDTSEVVLEDMLLHCRSVARGAKGAFTVCDYQAYISLPYLCFIIHTSPCLRRLPSHINCDYYHVIHAKVLDRTTH